MKIQTLVNSYESLINLATKDLKAKASYKLSKLIKKVDKELETFYEQRSTLIKKYGTPSDENPDQYTFDDENSHLFNDEISSILDIDVDMDVCPIALDELGDTEVSALTLSTLDWLVTE